MADKKAANTDDAPAVTQLLQEEQSKDGEAPEAPQKDEEPAQEEAGDKPGGPNVAPSVRHQRRRVLVVVVIVVVILAALVVVYMMHARKTPHAAYQQQTKDQVATTAIAPQPIKTATAVTNTYFDELKPLGDLGMFKNPEQYFGTSCDTPVDVCTKPAVVRGDVKYYQAGTTSDGREINIVSIPNTGITGVWYLVIGKAGAYKVLDNFTGSLTDKDLEYDIDSLPAALGAGFSLDTHTKFEDFIFPNPVTVAGQPMATYGRSFPLLNGVANVAAPMTSKPKNLDKLEQNGIYTFYQAVTNDQPTFKVVNLYAMIKGVWAAGYRPDFAGINNSGGAHQAIAWTSGENTSAFYFSGGQGCSALGYVVAKDIEPAELIPVGTLDGASVYQLPTAHPLVQEVYNKDYDPSGSQYLEDKTLANLTIDQFTAKHGYVIMQNKLGEYILLQRDGMFVRGGCAKPVVYLYPTTATSVSVQVGARVAKSDPQYEKDGWQQVLAQPSGGLTYKGKMYSSLFWEGYGDGPYPMITTGTVVPTMLAADTIRLQLARQGLNQSEIADFMAYWGPKLPTDKPFTRLTWLTGAEIEALAPLQVLPKPQTVIRVFLDFEGQDAPGRMAPQTLSAPERRGFTVVEWGGLARTGL